jgi:hypothetical protein
MFGFKNILAYRWIIMICFSTKNDVNTSYYKPNLYNIEECIKGKTSAFTKLTLDFLI